MVSYENIIQIELIDDPTDIAERRNAAGFGDVAQACNRCGKRSVAIAAILKSDPSARHDRTVADNGYAREACAATRKGQVAARREVHLGEVSLEEDENKTCIYFICSRHFSTKWANIVRLDTGCR